MKFYSTLYRYEDPIDVIVDASVERMADAVGAPPEMRPRFYGDLSVEIVAVVGTLTGAEIEPTDEERTRLEREAAVRARQF